MTATSRLALAAVVSALALACAPAERTCASSGDCLTGETCVLNAEGGRCLASSPGGVIAPPVDAGSDPTDDPSDDPTDPNDPETPPDDPATDAASVTAHGLVAAAGNARSATFRVVQHLSTSPRQALSGPSLEVHP